MKVSYKVLKSLVRDIGSVEDVSNDLIMHTAEVEEIHYEGEELKKVFIGKVLECKKYTDSEKLNCTKVEVKGNVYSIVCGASNVKEGIKVPVALVGAKLGKDFEIKKTKIRGETSEGMICSEDELGLIDERQEGILELPEDAPLGLSMKEYLNKNDAILEVDNKAINHRPDLFSHFGIARELEVIKGNIFEYKYEYKDFSNLPDLGIKNNIPKQVRRYMGLKIEGVGNIETPDFIKKVIESAGVSSKGLLIDITNYSLYYYGQPMHAFDADKIDGGIVIRNALNGEKFIALDDVEYELNDTDIVIADNSKVLALGGIIGGKDSAVSSDTQNIILEAAWFEQSIIRKSGRRLGIRTDSLNVFEKNIPLELPSRGLSLVYNKLKELFPESNETSFSDIYESKQEVVKINYNLDYINSLIGANYDNDYVLKILKGLGIEFDGKELVIPFWRTDLSYESDIAEEIARINGYNNIEATIPRINLGAVIQDNSYKIKKDTRNFFVNRGFYDLYNYSFVNKKLVEKLNLDINDCIGLKNFLSEDMTHMKNSLIPNLMLSIEKNIKEKKELSLFEVEKVFKKSKNNQIEENYELAGVLTGKDNEIVYRKIQNLIIDYLKTLYVDKFNFDIPKSYPNFSHKGRTGSIIVRGKEVGYIGEIHPNVSTKFGAKNRIGFFQINLNLIENATYSIVKAKEVSIFQENNFDLSFVVRKDIKGKDIQSTIFVTDNKIINKVELIDIYEDEVKLPGKRSLSFRIYIQSLDGTLDDEIKSNLINNIIKKVEKKGGKLRN